MTDRIHFSDTAQTAIRKSLFALKQSKSVKKAISCVLSILGEALQADRASFFKAGPDSKNNFCLFLKVDWHNQENCQGKIIEDPVGGVLILDHVVEAELRKKKIQNVLVQDSSDKKIREWWESRGTLSYGLIPVVVGEEFYGVFCFENCGKEKIFTQNQVRVFRDFSNSFSRNLLLKLRSQRAFRKASEYQELLSNIQEVVFRLNSRLEIRYLTGPWFQWTGFHIKDCMGKPIFDYFEKKGAEKFHSKVKDYAFAQEEDIAETLTLLTANDSPREVLLNLKMITRGTNVDFIGSLKDIHDLYVDYNKLKESEAKLKSLVENVEDVLYSLDPETGSLLFISDTIELFGYKKTELLEDPEFWWRQIVPEDKPEVLKAYTNFLENKLPNYEIEYRIKKPDGSIVWVNDKFGKEINPGKNPAKLHGRISEITKQKDKEIQLQQTENRFRIITESLPFPFILSREEDFRLIYYNYSFHEHFQVRTGESAAFDSNWIDQLVTLESKELFENFLKENTDFSNHETLLKTKEGPQWYSVSSQSIPYKTGFARAIVFYNINKRKLSELELIRLNDLIQAVNQTQVDFFLGDEIQDTFYRLLENLMTFSESSSGFLAEIAFDEKGLPLIKPNADSNFPWIDELWGFISENLVEGKSKTEVLTSVEEVKYAGAIISNDFSQEIGVCLEKSAHGQISINRFLGIPIFKGETLTGMAGLGNKDKPYSQEDVDFLKPFLSSYANLIVSLNVNREKRKAEILQKESESLYRILSQNIDDIVTLHDLDLKTIYASPSLEKVTGYEINEFLGKNFFELFDFRPLEEPDFTKFPSFVIPLKHAGNGREIKLEMLWKPIYNDKGELTSFLATSRDVTERELVLAELTRTLEKEIELNRLKSKFITMTSHELRTPLATIQSSADLMEIFTESVQDEKAHEGLVKQIRKIQIQLSRLSQMISDVMLFEKNNEGKLVYNQSEVDLRSLIVQMVDNQFISLGNGSKIDLQLGEKTKIIKTDPNLLFHVLRNLIENALKYTPEGKAKPSLKLLFKKNNVQIILQDYGIGIPEKERKFVFDTFFRASNVKNIKGTGLGLSIVNDLVKLLGGKLNFTSEENKGSIFTVTLPYERNHSID